MSDASSSQSSQEQLPPADDVEREPLWQRLLYMLGFWFLGNIAFSVCILLAAVQFIVVLIRGEKNEDLHGFSANLVQFVWECLTYVTFGQEEKPFPLGSFPNVKE